MTGKKRLEDILKRHSTQCGFWHGNPNQAAQEQLYRYFNVSNDFELGLKLGSTFRWVFPEDNGAWQPPNDTPMFDVLGGQERYSLSQDGIFANTESVKEIEEFPWPEVKHLNFSDTLADIKRTQNAGQAVFSGMWSCFFHNVSDFFGMENYFVKMHTDPDVVDAVTKKVVDFYLDANEALYDMAGDRIDVFFFGNDLGSQLDLLISPDCYERFIHPYIVKLVQQAKRRGYAVALHSCGSIYRIIPRLIDAGIDFLHPIQAKATNMHAEYLTHEFGGAIAFIGGVDTQTLLPFGTEQELREDIERLKILFGNNYILSPSHESVLPNVAPVKLEIMSSYAR